jgi:hypothetical protein
VAEIIILEFQNIGKQEYDAVNRELGIDTAAGTGDWPPGIRFHFGGANDAGEFFVAEIWDSQDAQAEWMNGRLGEALGKVGVPAPVRVTWLDVLGEQRL